MSADHQATLKAFAEKNGIAKQLLLSDFRRTMLPKYDALVTDEASPIYRYAKRAYFIIDRQGTVRFVKYIDNPLNVLKPDEILAALKGIGA